MQSKTSCFNPALFRKNLQRFWPLWLSYMLVWVVTGPLVLAGDLLGRYHVYDVEAERIFRVSRSLLASATEEGPYVIAVFSAFFAMALFSYLYQPRAVGMLHSMPIRREALFATNYLTGLFFFLSTHLVTVLGMLLVTAATNVLDVSALLAWFALTCGETLFFFSFAVFCAQFTGQILALPVFYGILNLVAIGFECMVCSFAGNFLYGYRGHDNYLLMPLSPIVEMTRMDCDLTSDAAGQVTGWALSDCGMLWWYALAGLAFAVGAWFVYRVRRSETAGDVVTVRWAKPLFRYGAGVCFAVILGQGLYYVLFGHNLSAGEYSLAGTLLCMVFTGLLGYFGAEMLLQKSFHVLRSALGGALVLAAGLAVFGVGMTMDLFGYEGYIPDSAQVESVNLSANTQNADCYGRYTDPQTIENTLALHRAAVADKARQMSVSDGFYEDTGTGQSWFSVTYTLKDGRSVSRSYTLNYYADELTQPGSVTQTLNALFNSEQVLLKQALGYGREDPFDSLRRFTGGTIYSDVRTEDGSYTEKSTELSAVQAQQLYDAVWQDVAAGNLKNDIFAPQQLVNLSICLDYRDADGMDCLYVNVFAGMEHTLAFLQSLDAGYEAIFRTYQK